MQIYIASDHGGFELKKRLIIHLEKKSHKVSDLGPFNFDPLDDYPDFAIPIAQKVASEKDSLGILVCRSGIGASIAANKVKGAYAGTCVFSRQTYKSRTDDGCNILVIPADYISEKQAKENINIFLATPALDADRHIRRMKKIKLFERKTYAENCN